MAGKLTQLDLLLLERLQRDVPLVCRPYAALAAELAWPEAALIARVEELSGPEGVIREIAGIFDAAGLGYHSLLAALTLPARRLDRAGVIVSDHPGVSHCYARRCRRRTPPAPNLWFTLALPPQSRLGLEGTLDRLKQLTGATACYGLPVLRRFKLDARVAFTGLVESAAAGTVRRGTENAEKDREDFIQTQQGVGAFSQPVSSLAASGECQGHDEKLSDLACRAIAALQTPLPAIAQPFAVIASPAGLSESELLSQGRELLAAGLMRRYAAVLRHRAAGATENVLLAWQVPQERIEEFGQFAAASPAVSHCYQRQTSPDWPYNFYTMLHGSSPGQMRGAIAELAALGKFPHLALRTVREYKKRKIRFFSPEFERWEEQNVG